MIKQIKNKLGRKNKKGFTLIELIVVIAIVAVLAAVGIPAIAGQVAKSQQASADSNAKLIAEQAQILLTQAEAAGGATPSATNCVIKDKFGTAADITITVTGTAGVDGTDFTDAVAAAASVDVTSPADLEITLVGIKDGADFVGAKVEGVKYTAKNGKTVGIFGTPA